MKKIVNVFKKVARAYLQSAAMMYPTGCIPRITL